MSSEHESESSNQLTGKLGWFLTGAAVGAAIALLYAPRSGRDTRKLLSKTGRAGKEAVTETSRELVETGRDLYDRGCQLVEDAAELFERGRNLVRG
jgi:gas vesicle protein